MREGLAASKCIDHTSTGGLCGHGATAQHPPRGTLPSEFRQAGHTCVRGMPSGSREGHGSETMTSVHP